MTVSLKKPSKNVSVTLNSTHSPYTIHGNAITSGSTAANSVDWTISYKSPMDELVERVEEIEERLAIIKVDEVLHEKYPALKEAYDAYNLVKALVKDQSNEST